MQKEGEGKASSQGEGHGKFLCEEMMKIKFRNI